ncbi:immunity protein [Lactiplantibacillus mudanjiangensis]|uniref:Immunity protein [Lactobacillus coryniformis subsp. coryniformis KCTC 3167 = DSM] n=1 Tax=Lactiplantibacillus mudanjiangensis TaxID=1296538 RepID=A0A660E5W9_9LACO|nr:immunity protein [Lactiplantibacillus mudanjiangensis]VDG18025.1 immunity protein [Lactobacillus coryniformis subsp. coryniformis KCTC 3167 = DSM] [Lactiplantibacillus mudanjiangensis]VDG24808.1 immunity protein [Lactobacillus coryniformis subsp. coryniformis KCTC 3167 = DSM] [Lactiplantibacillus mudanjiangensis]VDG28445.1 immunity protein [Lactobacillus coryniformis subsp. coryniformis KCTC 3167 = DSM] [Lactiplantibacillus mudanjiangensis]VDG32270.1 immunity protein [Lactobacillus corynifor
MIVKLVGIACLALSIWQFYAAKNAFMQVKHHGNQGTSAFIAFGLWYGFLFGIILLFAGIMLLFYGLPF